MNPYLNLDELVKSRNSIEFVIPVTLEETFCEIINLRSSLILLIFDIFILIVIYLCALRVLCGKKI
jgi:hypothetical protein